MKVRIIWAAPDGTTQEKVIRGEHIITQLWDGGRAIVKVLKRGRIVRVVHFTWVALIEKDLRGRKRDRSET